MKLHEDEQELVAHVGSLMRKVVGLSAAVLAACGSGVTPVLYHGDARDPSALSVEGVPDWSCGTPTHVLGEYPGGHREPLRNRVRFACVLGASVILELAADSHTSRVVWILPRVGARHGHFSYLDRDVEGPVVQVRRDLVEWSTVRSGACARATFHPSPPSVVFSPCDAIVSDEQRRDGPSAEELQRGEAQVRGMFGTLRSPLPPFDPEAPPIVERSQQRAVARISRVDEECSDAGGTHVTFEVETVERGRPARLLAAGGHGVFYDPSVVHPGARFCVSWWAGDVPLGRRTWPCVELPEVDGTVTAAVPLP